MLFREQNCGVSSAFHSEQRMVSSALPARFKSLIDKKRENSHSIATRWKFLSQNCLIFWFDAEYRAIKKDFVKKNYTRKCEKCLRTNLAVNRR